MHRLRAALLAWLPLACGPSSTAAPVYPEWTVAGAFTPPGPRQRQAAVGSLQELPRTQRALFEESDGAFAPVPAPMTGDWLDEQRERFQTFDRYRAVRKVHPDAEHRTIYLVQIGAFEGEGSPSVDTLARYSEAFFGLPVRRLDPIDLVELDVDARQSMGQIQLHARQILERLEQRRPDDAWVLAAVTMYDLYPDDDWNFVFGFASAKKRVGVFSFARFDPALFGRPRGADFEQHMLRRSITTLTHELGHMFGISHCTHYHCLMNGHNHEAEGERLPLHLCPVDLRKIVYSTGVDPVARYEALATLDAQLGLTEEAQWIRRRLDKVPRRSSSPVPPRGEARGAAPGARGPS